MELNVDHLSWVNDNADRDIQRAIRRDRALNERKSRISRFAKGVAIGIAGVAMLSLLSYCADATNKFFDENGITHDNNGNLYYEETGEPYYIEQFFGDIFGGPKR